MPSYDVLMTRDTTESALIPVEAATAEEAEAMALDAYRAILAAGDVSKFPAWEADDSAQTPYIADPGNAAFPADAESETCAHCGEERLGGPQSSSWLCPNNHFNEG